MPRGGAPGFQHKNLPMAPGRFIKVGKRIREARLYHGLSQRQLSEQAKVARNHLNQWERGHTLPSIRSFMRIAEVTGCSLDYLAGLSEKKTVDKENV